ncbi:MAG: efflux transporter outer membrane subunit [Proteobacteria bacterium]|nr:efflux transporter outer membrane subunit [Pseudomonadota bacterium]
MMNGQFVSRLRPVLVFLIVAATGACAPVGPDYVQPGVETPPAFKEGQGWKVARPDEATLPDKWWQIFHDQTLNALEEQVLLSNQNIAVAEAQYRQAKALAEASEAARYPALAQQASATRSRSSANAMNGRGTTANDFTLPANLSWEIDLWGRIRRSVEAGKASLQASEADLAGARLSAQALLATTFFQLRTADAQIELLRDTVSYYQKSLAITKNLYAAEVAGQADVLQAESLLKSAQASLVDAGVQRTQCEHAIALLIGKPASSFSLPAMPLDNAVPVIPGALPSELLERRPDIRSSERLMAAANAQIGVVTASYYPTVQLGASFGLEASEMAQWISWPSRFWAVGPSISASVFDGGLRRAQSDQARAAYEASVAAYRQTVLNAFSEVEDHMAALRLLADEAKIREEARAAASQAAAITLNQYQAGTVGYLKVFTAQIVETESKSTVIGILGRQMTSSVALVKALGGGWSPSH